MQSETFGANSNGVSFEELVADRWVSLRSRFVDSTSRIFGTEGDNNDNQKAHITKRSKSTKKGDVPATIKFRERDVQWTVLRDHNTHNKNGARKSRHFSPITQEGPREGGHRRCRIQRPAHRTKSRKRPGHQKGEA